MQSKKFKYLSRKRIKSDGVNAITTAAVTPTATSVTATSTAAAAATATDATDAAAATAVVLLLLMPGWRYRGGRGAAALLRCCGRYRDGRDAGAIAAATADATEGMEGVLLLSLCESYIKIKTCLVGYGWSGGCCGIVGANEGWRVREVIEINVSIRTLIISKFQMSLVKKCRL